MILEKITAEQFNSAFAEFVALGPRTRLPLEQRWHEILHGMNPELFTALKAQCREIEAFAFSLRRDIPRDEAVKQIAQKYPFLNHECLAHTWGWAIYLWSYS